MRQDKREKYQGTGRSVERLLVYTGMYTFGGKSVISYILSESYSIRICRCADRTERRFFSTDPAGESNGRDTD